MKKQELADIKKGDKKFLTDQVGKIKQEIADLVMDKNMNKLKDLKSIFKKRQNLAQILTVLKQRELVERLEGSLSKEEQGGKK